MVEKISKISIPVDQKQNFFFERVKKKSSGNDAEKSPEFFPSWVNSEEKTEKTRKKAKKTWRNTEKFFTIRRKLWPFSNYWEGKFFLK